MYILLTPSRRLARLTPSPRTLEILVVNSGIVIREGKTHQIPSMMQTGTKFGMQTLNEALFSFVEDGTVDAKEALYRAVDKISFESMLTTHGYA